MRVKTLLQPGVSTKVYFNPPEISYNHEFLAKTMDELKSWPEMTASVAAQLLDFTQTTADMQENTWARLRDLHPGAYASHTT